jgi:signal peptidase I
MNPIIKNLTASITLIMTALVSMTLSVHAEEANGSYEFTRISGNSMLPTLKSGEMAVVFKSYPFEKLRIGDVVIIESDRGFSVIHRIVRRNRGGTWVTQGDNNAREDRELLGQDNFGGLALVDESMVRFQKFVSKMSPEAASSLKVALADKTAAVERLNGLRKS